MVTLVPMALSFCSHSYIQVCLSWSQSREYFWYFISACRDIFTCLKTIIQQSFSQENEGLILSVTYGYLEIHTHTYLQAGSPMYLFNKFFPQIWSSEHYWNINRNTQKSISTNTNNPVFRTTDFPLTWILKNKNASSQMFLCYSKLSRHP